jgi:hypothetical protein
MLCVSSQIEHWPVAGESGWMRLGGYVHQQKDLKISRNQWCKMNLKGPNARHAVDKSTCSCRGCGPSESDRLADMRQAPRRGGEANLRRSGCQYTLHARPSSLLGREARLDMDASA